MCFLNKVQGSDTMETEISTIFDNILDLSKRMHYITITKTTIRCFRKAESDHAVNY